jgi:hypothetical protein
MSFIIECDNFQDDKYDTIIMFHACILAILLCMLLLCYTTKREFIEGLIPSLKKTEGMSPSLKPMETEWNLLNRNPYDDIDYQTPVFIRHTSFH